jgi:hypothetical protein
MSDTKTEIHAGTPPWNRYSTPPDGVAHVTTLVKPLYRPVRRTPVKPNTVLNPIIRVILERERRAVVAELGAFGLEYHGITISETPYYARLVEKVRALNEALEN